MSLLEVSDLRVVFRGRRGLTGGRAPEVPAVCDVSLWVEEGETLGLVGESGCGKSTIARSVMQLVRPASGRVVFDGADLTSLTGERLRRARLGMQMVFQDPYSSLNRRWRVGRIIAEPMRAQGSVPARERAARVAELLEMVGLDAGAADRFPHAFSGGQRQRIAIARALALRPRLLVCDEPISALDTSIQAQIINLLRDLQREFTLSLLFIAHDLSMVRYVSDRVAVMYAGRIVESADSVSLYQQAAHPYTRRLLDAIPVPDPDHEPVLQSDVDRRPAQGETPSAGCPFRPRCPLARSVCAEREPPLVELRPGHHVACHVVAGTA